jgi:hypothetical protein
MYTKKEITANSVSYTQRASYQLSEEGKVVTLIN